MDGSRRDDRDDFRTSESFDNDEVVSSRKRKKLRLLVMGVLAVFVTCALIWRDQIQEATRLFLAWVETHPAWGVIAFILLYALATVLFVPGAILTIGCGFTFGSVFGIGKGVALASVAVFVGATIGSIAAFLLGRYLFKDCVASLIRQYPTFEAIDRALEGNGLVIMVLLRLSPLIPYNALDYMSGATSIPLWSYSLALVAVLPGVFMYTFLGASASSLADSENVENSTIRLVSLIFGITFAVLGVAVASYYANRELNKILSDGEEAGDTHSDSSASSMLGSDSSRGMLLV